MTLRSSTLNHTFTAMASRLLRVNILSPITGKVPRYLLSIWTFGL